jgi:hypothetical protein
VGPCGLTTSTGQREIGFGKRTFWSFIFAVTGETYSHSMCLKLLEFDMVNLHGTQGPRMPIFVLVGEFALKGTVATPKFRLLISSSLVSN